MGSSSNSCAVSISFLVCPSVRRKLKTSRSAIVLARLLVASSHSLNNDGTSVLIVPIGPAVLHVALLTLTETSESINSHSHAPQCTRREWPCGRRSRVARLVHLFATSWHYFVLVSAAQHFSSHEHDRPSPRRSLNVRLPHPPRPLPGPNDLQADPSGPRNHRIQPLPRRPRLRRAIPRVSGHAVHARRFAGRGRFVSAPIGQPSGHVPRREHQHGIWRPPRWNPGRFTRAG